MTHLPIAWIRPGSPARFPPPAQALREPDGLLALGGDLSMERLLAAYRHGIFPWYGQDEPILWWSPDPRCIFDLERLHPDRSLRKLMRKSDWTVTVDRTFRDVMQACAAPRAGQRGGTWITDDMVRAYTALHDAGHAHSIEVWHGPQLVGGLYGIAVGRMFCGESMFSNVSGGSKVALVCLGQLLRDWGFPWLDAQVGNPHLYRMGAENMPRREYLAHLETLVHDVPASEAFTLDDAIPVQTYL
ncbi:MAG TPA: leucyl/phenylalanyl-tRNA--protein transferase [Rhodanobacteraceae bacterium]|nr:leucyl/phenylalanyl-tRNA--protein transferase [Rhodanobacteraceae bacterium]